MLDAADIHRAKEIDVPRPGQVVVRTVGVATLADILMRMVMAVLLVNTSAFRAALGSVLRRDLHDCASFQSSLIGK